MKARDSDCLTRLLQRIARAVAQDVPSERMQALQLKERS
jgi:hypothetical protein